MSLDTARDPRAALQLPRQPDRLHGGHRRGRDVDRAARRSSPIRWPASTECTRPRDDARHRGLQRGRQQRHRAQVPEAREVRRDHAEEGHHAATPSCSTGSTASRRASAKRKDGVITLRDASARAHTVWGFRRGLPTKYSGPQLNAQQSAVAIETITIAHEGLSCWAARPASPRGRSARPQRDREPVLMARSSSTKSSASVRAIDGTRRSRPTRCARIVDAVLPRVRDMLDHDKRVKNEARSHNGYVDRMDREVDDEPFRSRARCWSQIGPNDFEYLRGPVQPDRAHLRQAGAARGDRDPGARRAAAAVRARQRREADARAVLRHHRPGHRHRRHVGDRARPTSSTSSSRSCPSCTRRRSSRSPGTTSSPATSVGDAWGSQRRNSFTGVAESVRQRFTMFSPEGVPLRATVTLVLREFRPIEQQLDELNLSSPDRTHRHRLAAGETLSARRRALLRARRGLAPHRRRQRHRGPAPAARRAASSPSR